MKLTKKWKHKGNKQKHNEIYEQNKATCLSRLHCLLFSILLKLKDNKNSSKEIIRISRFAFYAEVFAMEVKRGKTIARCFLRNKTTNNLAVTSLTFLLFHWPTLGKKSLPVVDEEFWIKDTSQTLFYDVKRFVSALIN